MIRYAGVNLGCLDATLAGWLASAHPVRALPEFDRRYQLPFDARLPFDAPPEAPAVRPGVLHWPAGASRFAVAHYVLDVETYLTLRANAASGNRLLELGDAAAPTLAAAMWLLPARPLAQVEVPGQVAKGGLWLVTLVDDRYRWWFQTGTITVSEGSTTWADLYSQIGSALGVSIAAEAVHADYLTPTAAFAADCPLPTLLDAVALACGQRIWRNPDGTVEALNSATALQRQAQEWAANRPRRGGGLIPLGNNAYGVDAQTPPASGEVARILPDTVQVYFPSVPETATVAVAGLDLAPLQMTGTFAGTRRVRHGTPPGSNTTTRTAMATRWAADWCRWRCGGLDVTYDGVHLPVMSPLLDAVEWGAVMAEEAGAIPEGHYTRLYRGPWNDVVDDLGSAGLTVEEADGTPSVANVRKVIFDQATGLNVANSGNGSVTVSFSGAGAPLTVEEVDGTPSVSGVSVIEFYQLNGFVVTDQGGGEVRVDMAPASTSARGIVNTTTQTFGGTKGFAVDAYMNDGLVFAATTGATSNYTRLSQVAGQRFEITLDSGGGTTESGADLVYDSGGGPTTTWQVQAVASGSTRARFSCLDAAGTFHGVDGTDALGNQYHGGILYTLGTGTIDTAEIADNSVTDAKLRQSAGYSVIGRSASSTGNVADITASGNNQTLMRTGGAVGFVDGFHAVSVPATASSTGEARDLAIDPVGGWLYICTATDTWVRAPLTFATW